MMGSCDACPAFLLCLQLPYVMNELTLTELDMGFSIPKILQASAPTVDHQGRPRRGGGVRSPALALLLWFSQTRTRYQRMRRVFQVCGLI